MTACLYVSPSTVPGTITDTLVTFADIPVEYFISPNELATPKVIERLAPVTLARKIKFIDEHTCLTAAGRVDQIMDFFLHAPALIRHHLTDERPLLPLSDYANQFPDISVLGCQVRENFDLATISRVSERFEAGHFGLCAATGSGAYDWRKKTIEWGAYQRPENQTKYPVELIRGIACAHNARVIHDEFFTGGLKNSWGAFCEYSWFDHGKRKWVFGPKNIYAHLHGVMLNENEFTFFVIPKLIFYDGSQTHGHVMSMFKREEGDVVLNWILSDHQDDEKIASPFIEEWKPDFVTFSLTMNIGNDGKHSIRSLNDSEMNYIKFSFIDKIGKLSFYIDHDLMKILGNDFGERFGLRYRICEDMNQIPVDKAFIA